MPDVLCQWQHYLALLDVPEGARVLDVGCGSGDPLRLLARTAPGAREFVGLDKRFWERFTENYTRAKAEDSRIRFQEGNALALPFTNNSFERVLCADMLEWVAEPRLALAEIRRVLKPSGVAVVIHSDFDSQLFAARDRERNRGIVHAFSDAGPNGQMGRELLGICRQSNFVSVDASVYVLVNTEWRPNLYAFQVAHMMTDWLASKQLIAESDLTGWLADLHGQNEAGSFFYSINRIICRCVK